MNIKKKREIRENIWYKLFMLQNYKITKDMFIGSNLRWRSIENYATYIRNLYKGKPHRNMNVKSLENYIQGLIDSGMEPYKAPIDKKISIESLIDSGTLTRNQIEQIYDSVSENDNEPDTSILFNRVNNSVRSEYNTGSYTQIVPQALLGVEKQNVLDKINKVTKLSTMVTNPLKFNIHKGFNLAENIK